MRPDFEKYTDALLPVIIQDSQTQQVLMLGYMNEAALVQTNQEGYVTFYSRSKKRLWTKGETSGHFLKVVQMNWDCDQDCLLIQVRPQGPVCHTGQYSCFGKVSATGYFLPYLEQCILDRREQHTDSSYTAQLFSKGLRKIAQKVGEEAVELVIEAIDNKADLFKEEAADLLFHYLVLLQAKGYFLKDIEDVLKARHLQKNGE